MSRAEKRIAESKQGATIGTRESEEAGNDTLSQGTAKGLVPGKAAENDMAASQAAGNNTTASYESWNDTMAGVARVRRQQPVPYPQAGVANTSRSYEEYVRMFALNEHGIADGPCLDVAGGASSFTAQLHEQGISAIAADPFYSGEPEQVIAAARQEIDVSTAKLAAAAASYDWSYYGSISQHRQMREASLERFAADFKQPDASSRYIAASLPDLPFADGTFALVVCSHFLFLYGDQFDETFHRLALSELLRVAKPGGQVRVYPLVTLQWQTPPYLSTIIAELQAHAEVRMIDTRLPFTPIKSPVLHMVKFS